MAKPTRRVIDGEEAQPHPMDVDPAVVAFIILRARAFDAKVDPVEPDPGSNPTDDDDRAILEDLPDDRTETELRDAIEQQSDDAALDLITLLWIGRGDFTAAEWDDARALAAERAREDIAPYLMGEPNLGDFLEEGLEQMGYASEEYMPE